MSCQLGGCVNDNLRVACWVVAAAFADADSVRHVHELHRLHLGTVVAIRLLGVSDLVPNLVPLAAEQTRETAELAHPGQPQGSSLTPHPTYENVATREDGRNGC
uniref:Uncharacterized protein n=1 Tax=Arundo donax TaxID=35708 RepID=A0A0A9E672_ARUDO